MAYKRFNPLFVPMRGKKVLKSNRNNMPVNMFGDNDRDGVDNVFDCKPNNPKEEGFIANLIGGIKGVASGSGWKQGVREAELSHPRKERSNYSPSSYAAGMKYRKELPQRKAEFATQRKAEFAKQEARKAVIRQNVQQGIQNVKQGMQRFRQDIGPKKTVMRKIPTAWSVDPNTGKQVATKYKMVEAKVPMTLGSYMMSERQRVREGRATKWQKHKSQVPMKMVQMAFPGVKRPAGVEYYQTGKRGRPPGSFKYPGGVFAWRKLMRAQKAAARYQGMLQRTQAAQSYPQMAAARQAQLQARQMQEYQPQEMQQYPEMTPAELLQQQIQQQMSQPQYAQEPQKRPIATVFKSSGGHPYPAVSSQPLASSRQTIPQGYVEVVDSFTGRRYYKQLPKTESWIQ